MRPDARDAVACRVYEVRCELARVQRYLSRPGASAESMVLDLGSAERALRDAAAFGRLSYSRTSAYYTIEAWYRPDSYGIDRGLTYHTPTRTLMGGHEVRRALLEDFFPDNRPARAQRELPPGMVDIECPTCKRKQALFECWTSLYCSKCGLTFVR